jgi:four helix bundle protein
VNYYNTVCPVMLHFSQRRIGTLSNAPWKIDGPDLERTLPVLLRMAGLRDYRDFDVWKLANEVRIRIGRITARPGFREHMWLRSQLRRAANSACANGGEGFSRYRPLEFARFLDVVKGSLTEIIEHLDDVLALKLASEREADEICTLCRRARGAATGLIRYLRSTDAASKVP